MRYPTFLFIVNNLRHGSSMRSTEYHFTYLSRSRTALENTIPPTWLVRFHFRTWWLV